MSQEKLKCPGCKERFVPKDRRQKFCGGECRSRHNQKIYRDKMGIGHKKPKICKRDGCGKEVVQHKGYTKHYCSAECKNKYNTDVQYGRIRPRKVDDRIHTYEYQMRCYDFDKEFYLEWASKPIRSNYNV